MFQRKWSSKVLKIGCGFFAIIAIILSYFVFFKKNGNELKLSLNYENDLKYAIDNRKQEVGCLQKLNGSFNNVSYGMCFPMFENRAINKILFDDIISKIYHYKKSNLAESIANDKFEFFSNYQTFNCKDDGSVSIQMQFLERNLTKKKDFQFLKTYVFKNEKLVDAKKYFKNSGIKNVVSLIKKKFIDKYPKLSKINLEKVFPYNLQTVKNFVETENSLIFFYLPDEFLKGSHKIISVEIEKSLVYDYIKDDFKPKKAEDGEVINKPKVALTFDDGPNPSSTQKILDVLNQNDAKATFFVLGLNCEKHPELLSRMVEDDHEIGNHTYSHKNLNKVSEKQIGQQIEKTNSIISKATGGYEPSLVRPPGGYCNQKVKKLINYPLILWSVDTLDWRTRNSEETIDKVLKLAKDGSIILMHDIYEETAKAVEYIVPKLIEKGFDLVTVSNLFDSKNLELEAHKPHYRAENF